jgi:hypothetical protein
MRTILMTVAAGLIGASLAAAPTAFSGSDGAQAHSLKQRVSILERKLRATNRAVSNVRSSASAAQDAAATTQGNLDQLRGCFSIYGIARYGNYMGTTSSIVFGDYVGAVQDAFSTGYYSVYGYVPNTVGGTFWARPAIDFTGTGETPQYYLPTVASGCVGTQALFRQAARPLTSQAVNQ